MAIHATKLPNGLRVAAARVDGTSFVDVVVAIRTGSRYEAAGQSGISHFLEHLIFRGSKRYPSSHLLNHALESLGDGLEGGTSREYTAFSIALLPDRLPEILSIVGDLFLNPLLSDMDTEREIILEEMLEELDEKGEESQLENISRRLLFGGHALGRPVLGRRATLESITAEELREHFDQQYTPANMVVAAAGNLDPRMFFELVAEQFGPVACKLPAELPLLDDGWFGEGGRDPAPEIPRGPVVRFRPKASSQIEVLVSFAGAGERSKGYLAQIALERVLDDGLASRLQRSLCERKGLLYDISVQLDGYTDVSAMDFSFRIVESKAPLALREIFQELRALKLELVDDDELARIKARLGRGAIELSEDSRSQALRSAEAILLGIPMPTSLESWKAHIARLSAEDIREAARAIFVPERMVALIEGEVPAADRAELTRILSEGLQ